MRLSEWSLSLFFGAAALAFAASGSTESEDPLQENTYFNQKMVPPMIELTPDNFEKEAKASKYLLVKHYR